MDGKPHRCPDFLVSIGMERESVPVHSAICMARDDEDCMAVSGVKLSEEALFRWIAEHCRDTGHVTYHRTSMATLHAEPAAQG